MIPGCLLALPLTMSGGLRFETPQDSAPPLLGIQLDTRLFVMPDAYAGIEVGYGGGIDDRNPEKVRAAGKFETALSLGWRPLLDKTWFCEGGARIGLYRVDGWPRGSLPSLHVYGPLIGVEVGGGALFAHPWGHPFGVEIRAGYDRLRIDGVWIGSPVVGLYATGQLLPEPPAK